MKIIAIAIVLILLGSCAGGELRQAEQLHIEKGGDLPDLQDESSEEWQDTTREVLALLGQSKYAEALPLAKRALRIAERELRSQWRIAFSLSNLGWAHTGLGDYEKAFSLFSRALPIEEKALGKDHPSVSDTLFGMVDVHYNQGNYEPALPLLLRALAIREKEYGKNHPKTKTLRKTLVLLYDKMGEPEKAKAADAEL